MPAEQDYQYPFGAGHTREQAGTVGGTGSASLLNDRRLNLLLSFNF
jgi:hypothetical protein